MDPETKSSPAVAEASSAASPPLALPTFQDIRGQDFLNNCAVRSVFSAVAAFDVCCLQNVDPTGGGFGIFMGLLLGAVDTPLNAEQMTVRQHFSHALRQMGSKSLHSAKTFAVLGAIFSGTECVVEKVRAKHDMKNTVVAGCVTGGAVSARAGPKAACLGCAGFATFSVLIEKIFDRHD